MAKTKKPTLYVKNEKGRYVEYQEPKEKDEVIDNSYYVKRNGKYERIGMTLPMEYLDEGVWIVTKNKHHTSYVSEEYARMLYRCVKACDIKNITCAEIGGLEKLADTLCNHWDEIQWDNCTRYDIARQILGILYKTSKANKE